MPQETYDAVVIGAGPNGLVAANRLLDAGWSVLVLEAQPDVGGAVRSDSELHPDFVHDTFSAFYPLAAASPSLQAFLEEHGLEWRHAPAVLGHPRPDGRGPCCTATAGSPPACSTSSSPATARRGWTPARWDRIGGHLVDALLAPFPPIRAGTAALARLRSVGGLDFVHPAVARQRARPGTVRRREPRLCWRATPATPTSRSTRPARG